MSHSRTYIPGMEPSNQSEGNLYARPMEAQALSGNETMIPGFSPAPPTPAASTQTKKANDVPVVGFLYSISRNGIPEFWPLHIGTNTIGRSSDCDIQLCEMSVSSMHATLNIKQMKSTGKFIASIRDIGSKSGLYLNEEELDYENHTCKHEDVITVGESYQLLLLLVDAVNYNLKPSATFKESVEATSVNSEVPPIPPIPQSGNLYSPSRRIEDGTVDLSGADYNNEAGETKFM